MREPNYRQAFLHSWQIVAEHKILWVFGLLSACLGQWGLGHFLGGLNLASVNSLASDGDMLSFWHAVLGAGHVSGMSAIFVAWLILIVVALVVLFIFVAVVSRGALIAAVGHWFAKDGKVPTTLAWRYGVKNFWEIFFLTILARAFEAALLLLAIPVFVYHTGTTAGAFVQALYGAVTLAVGLIVEVLTIFASGYVVIDGASVPTAISRAWRLLARHVLVVLELGILLVVINCLLVIGVLLSSFVVFIPAILIWLVAVVTGWNALIGVGVTLAIILFIIILVLSAGIFNAFNTSAWMYLFIKMHRENYVGWLLNRIKSLFVRK